jgi:phosphate-selective porin OprO and OprP
MHNHDFMKTYFTVKLLKKRNLAGSGLITFFILSFLLLNVGSGYAQGPLRHDSNNNYSDKAASVVVHKTYPGEMILPVDSMPEKKRDWNEADFGFTTARIGFAAIHDLAWYSQDDISKQQMDSAGQTLVTTEVVSKFRDFRFFASGHLNTKLPLTWKIAAMYDGSLDAWTFRETGLLIGLTKLNSNVFIGRSKEGYSMNKVENGYSCWMNERQMSLDLIPIMTDGIRWYGYLPKSGFLWSAGAFSNLIYGHGTKFMLYEWTYAGRIGWLPIRKDIDKKLLYISSSFRYARPDQDKIQVHSRPESNPAPYFIDTGKFQSDRCDAVEGEIYYRSGPFMVGSEVNVYHFNSVEAGDPTFFGGDVVVSYIFTGETRPWIKANAVFHFVEPKKPLFNGGFGALEGIVRLSYFDTNDGLKPGGSYVRFTPMVNWYATKNFRLELVYGYGELDRFNLKGKTNIFQTRFQFQLI